MIGYIYVTITDDGCYYIGQHKRKSFDESYKGSGKLLKKYSIKECKMIDQASTIEELNQKETYWINRCASKMKERCLNVSMKANSCSNLVYVNIKTKEAYYDIHHIAKIYSISISTVNNWINRFDSKPKMWNKAKNKRKLKKYQKELMYDWVVMSIYQYRKVKEFNIK